MSSTIWMDFFELIFNLFHMIPTYCGDNCGSYINQTVSSFWSEQVLRYVFKWCNVVIIDENKMYIIKFYVLKNPNQIQPIEKVNKPSWFSKGCCLWKTYEIMTAKDQLISKCLLGVFNSPKKRTKTIWLGVP